MKIASYTIALNEAQHVDRWVKAHKDCDYLYVLDTGSTDGTQDMLMQRGVTVYEAKYDPWRFDKPRQDLLDLLPEDVDLCMSIDMDEFLTPGWRPLIESAWSSDYNRVWYSYNHRDERFFWGNKFHARDTHYWIYPVHETVKAYGEDRYVSCRDVALNHWPDNSKVRSSYEDLLVLAMEEFPESQEHKHWWLQEHLNRLSGDVEYCEYIIDKYTGSDMITIPWYRQSLYQWLGSVIDDPQRQLFWYMLAAHECPDRRDSYVKLASYWFEKGDWARASSICERALANNHRVWSSLDQQSAWNGDLEWMAALCFKELGKFEDASVRYRQACEANPDNERLKRERADFLKSLKNPTTTEAAG